MKILPAVLVLLLATAAHADDEVFTEDGLAIRGYDPVAYFTAQAPVRGEPAFARDWNGARWLFASAGNLALFKADPAKYAPAFGGWCAYGMSQGYKVGTDPAAFTVKDGRLYLNYSIPVRSTWLKDTAGYIAQAERNWRELEHVPRED